MVWMHKIIWVCGKPIFKWVLVTKLEWARAAHLTGQMIAPKAAKYKAAAIIGGATCTGVGIGAPAWWGIRHYGDMSNTPIGRVAVPEPSTLAVMLVGIVALALIRARRYG